MASQHSRFVHFVITRQMDLRSDYLQRHNPRDRFSQSWPTCKAGKPHWMTLVERLCVWRVFTIFYDSGVALSEGVYLCESESTIWYQVCRDSCDYACTKWLRRNIVFFFLIVERVSLPDHSLNCTITGSVYRLLDTFVFSRWPQLKWSIVKNVVLLLARLFASFCAIPYL